MPLKRNQKPWFIAEEDFPEGMDKAVTMTIDNCWEEESKKFKDDPTAPDEFEQRCFVTFAGSTKYLRLSAANEDSLVNAYGADGDELDCKAIVGKRVKIWHEFWELKSRQTGYPIKSGYKVMIEPIPDRPLTLERTDAFSDEAAF